MLFETSEARTFKHKVRASTQEARIELAREQAALPSLEGVKVLAVDDEPDGLTLIAEVLGLCGAEVRTASAAALAAYASVEDQARALASGFQRHV